MKKFAVIIARLMLLMLSSCTREPRDPVPDEIGPAEFTLIYEDEAGDAYPDVEEVDLSSGSGYETSIYLYSSEMVTDFRLLSLEYCEVTEAGDLTMYSEVKYEKPVLGEGEVLKITMDFIGSIPNNGFSYVDTDGTNQYRTIEESGKDGSLYTGTFWPAEAEG